MTHDQRNHDEYSREIQSRSRYIHSRNPNEVIVWKSMPSNDLGPGANHINYVYQSTHKQQIILYTTENWELSKCQLCHHWWHCSLSKWQPAVPPVMTRLASWWFSVFSALDWPDTTTIGLNWYPCMSHCCKCWNSCRSHFMCIIETKNFIK